MNVSQILLYFTFIKTYQSKLKNHRWILQTSSQASPTVWSFPVFLASLNILFTNTPHHWFECLAQSIMWLLITINKLHTRDLSSGRDFQFQKYHAVHAHCCCFCTPFLKSCLNSWNYYAQTQHCSGCPYLTHFQCQCCHQMMMMNTKGLNSLTLLLEQSLSVSSMAKLGSNCSILYADDWTIL